MCACARVHMVVGSHCRYVPFLVAQNAILLAGLCGQPLQAALGPCQCWFDVHTCLQQWCASVRFRRFCHLGLMSQRRSLLISSRRQADRPLSPSSTCPPALPLIQSATPESHPHIRHTGKCTSGARRVGIYASVFQLIVVYHCLVWSSSTCHRFGVVTRRSTCPV